MQTIYTVAFFGHRYICDTNKIEEALFKHIWALVKEKDCVDCLVGRNGDFDRCVSSVIRHIRTMTTAYISLFYPTLQPNI